MLASVGRRRLPISSQCAAGQWAKGGREGLIEKAGLSGIVMELPALVVKACLLACLLRDFPAAAAHTKKLQRARLERVHAEALLQYTAIGAVVPLLQSFFPAGITFPPLPNPDV